MNNPMFFLGDFKFYMNKNPIINYTEEINPNLKSVTNVLGETLYFREKAPHTTVSLNGTSTMQPQSALNDLKAMVYKDEGYLLAKGNGDIIGTFKIEKINFSYTSLHNNGCYKQTNFDITLVEDLS